MIVLQKLETVDAGVPVETVYEVCHIWQFC